MKFPLGDILRVIVKPASKLGAILRLLKGTKIKVGEHEILLSVDERAIATPRGRGKPIRLYTEK